MYTAVGDYISTISQVFINEHLKLKNKSVLTVNIKCVACNDIINHGAYSMNLPNAPPFSLGKKFATFESPCKSLMYSFFLEKFSYHASGIFSKTQI